MLDFVIEDLELNIKFNDNTSNTYTVKVRKIILGAVKGIINHKEMHFISIVYDLELNEYLQNDPRDLLYYYKFNIFNIGKFFINLKLEYGLFPKNNFSLLNTINIKTDINKSKINISSRFLDTFFIFIVKIILPKFNLK